LKPNQDFFANNSCQNEITANLTDSTTRGGFEFAVKHGMELSKNVLRIEKPGS